METSTAPSADLVTADSLLKHWQGHRVLTRRTIAAFPEDKLFQFSIGGMRTFGEMACELLGMATPSVHGIATGAWSKFEQAKPETKSDLLCIWDAQTQQLDEQFPTITAEQFNEVQKAFGQWEMSGLALIQYVVDNEIHHRGEGFVYLRALGIDPPPFWQRNL